MRKILNFTPQKKNMIDIEALFRISYGLYIVASGDSKESNGYISNTVFQVTAEPPRFATCCNKDNFTSGIIRRCGLFSVSILTQDASSEVIGRFGYKSGRDTDKMGPSKVRTGVSGVPVVLDDAIAVMEFRVVETIDLGTHLMFIADLLESEILDPAHEPLTYAYYRHVKKGVAPKNAPTYVDYSKFSKAPAAGEKRFKCTACGYLYGDQGETIPFKELGEDYMCPLCGAGKEDFIET